jgi:hypothetical protein
MLLIGIIRSLSQQLESTSNSPYLSYFFCQGTDSKLNTATAVLRCLVWMVLVQQPPLISHLRKKYDPVGPKLFEDNKYTFYALLEALNNMLGDMRLARVYLIVDALDECIDKDKAGLAELLRLISTTIATSPKVKWLISSRNRSDIESQLRGGEGRVRLDLELNAQCISDAVDSYIDFKLTELNRAKQYGEETRVQIAEELRKRADGTFLWVALVCKELESVESYDALAVLREMPSDLKDLYDGMMRQIKGLKRNDPKFCKSVLSTMTLAYRPLHLSELAILTSLPIHVTEIIKKCASFLTVREDIVYLVHQSAKDYLDTHTGPEIFPHGRAEEHSGIVSRSLQAMSNTLKRDIYDLRNPGCSIEQVNSVDSGPLARIRYACVYWIDHLCKIDSSLYDQVGLCDNGRIDIFLKKHFLHWLEALSLMRSMSSGVIMIRKLENLLVVSINYPTMIQSLILS